MWNKKSSIGYEMALERKSSLYKEDEDHKQQVHRQLGDGYDSIVNYACGNKTKFLCSDY